MISRSEKTKTLSGRVSVYSVKYARTIGVCPMSVQSVPGAVPVPVFVPVPVPVSVPEAVPEPLPPLFPPPFPVPVPVPVFGLKLGLSITNVFSGFSQENNRHMDRHRASRMSKLVILFRVTRLCGWRLCQEPAETGSCLAKNSSRTYFQLVYWAVPASVQPSFCLRTPAERLTSEAGNGRKPQVAL